MAPPEPELESTNNKRAHNENGSQPQKKLKKSSDPPLADTKHNEPPKKRVNTAVYVSNLPPTTTITQLVEQFSKYGVLAEDFSSGEKKIKLYYNDDGKFKGDALVVYFRAESVPLAIALMDGAPFPDHTSSHKITVEPAKFAESSKNDKKIPKVLTDIDKTRIKQRAKKLSEKLGDWSEDDELQNETLSERHLARSVVINHAFSLDELSQDPNASSDIRDDLRDGCEDIGPVKNVTLYEGEPTGIAIVKFRNQDDALDCVDRMNGRYFGGRKLEAWIHDGTTYKRM